ncbi:LytTR family DNA-binding domain-containing protein [Phenylobacterium sp.]|uniref:LytR/AlgR family response regulator transcription factor n=1 Tax=Phenylobacterium sp. TaxID=1871053 RepID=UPI00286B9595|nr:LytTR family DNA-binding domain-containing protein [Phenylobacterium sp.]
MTPLRIVIADDEPVARQRLRRLLQRRGDCRLVGEFANGEAMAAGLPALSPDVVLLDIDMPGADGFTAFARLAEPRPLVVFVTAFSEHASRAFDIDAVDYLLKPVSGPRLDKTLGRILRRMAPPPASKAPADPARPAVRFMAQGRTYLLDPTTIFSIQAVGNYVEITTDTQGINLRSTLADAYRRLDPQAFVQVHRSWIVAAGAVAQVTSLPGSRYEILLADGRRVPGGRAFAKTITALVRRGSARP